MQAAVEEAQRRTSAPEIGLGMGVATQEEDYLQQLTAFHHQQQQEVYYEAATRQHRPPPLTHLPHNNHLTHQAQHTTEAVGSPHHPHFPPHLQPLRHHMEDQDLHSPLGALFPSPPPAPSTDSRTSSTATGPDMGMIKYEYELEEASMQHMLGPAVLME
jgi:hypothetical protein